jgi:4-hydroxy-tetrahydrodipicolinate synthase
MLSFSGSLVALVTPFTHANKIDYPACSNLLDWHLNSATDGIVILGTTGEAATITPTERAAFIQFVIDKVGSRLPVIVGTGSNCTQLTIEMTQQAHQLGAAAALIVTPYYNKPTQDGLFQHFSAVAAASDIPQILYNVPSRTGVDLHTRTIVRLQSIKNIAGLKDATGDLQRLKDLTETSLTLFSGDDASALQFIKLGGHGVISVTANAVPDLMRNLVNLAKLNDFAAAEDLNTKLKPLFEKLFMETNPIPVKWLLAQSGRIENVLRLPLTPLSVQYQDMLAGVIESTDISLLNSIK